MNYPTKLANLIVLVIDNKWKQIRCRLLNRICGVLRNVQRMNDTHTNIHRERERKERRSREKIEKVEKVSYSNRVQIKGLEISLNERKRENGEQSKERERKRKSAME